MAADVLLEIDGIKGESQDSVYPEALELLSWSWAESNMGSAGLGTGSGTEKVSMSDFSFQIQMGKASPKLAEACAIGKHIAQAVLHCRKAGGDPAKPGEEFLTFTFKNVFISNYSVGGASGIPTESISFNFTELEQIYKPQGETGTVSDNVRFAYNVKLGKTA